MSNHTGLGRIEIPKRYRRARFDARLGSIARRAEKIYGLPKGSMIFIGPDGRRVRSDATVRRLRLKYR